MIPKHIQIRLIKDLLLSILFCIFGCLACAQPALPQRTMIVTPTQGINFGKFCMTGGGGTVTVTAQGGTSSTGGIVLVSASNAHPAIFEIKLCPGRNISFNLGGTTHLSYGGSVYLDLVLDSTDKGLSFSTNSDCNFITPLRIGGTLTVPGGAPTGIYSGSFEITFNQQ